MFLTWVLVGMLLVAPALWVVLLMIEYFCTSELRSAVRGLDTFPDENLVEEPGH